MFSMNNLRLNQSTGVLCNCDGCLGKRKHLCGASHREEGWSYMQPPLGNSKEKKNPNSGVEHCHCVPRSEYELSDALIAQSNATGQPLLVQCKHCCGIWSRDDIPPPVAIQVSRRHLQQYGSNMAALPKKDYLRAGGYWAKKTLGAYQDHPPATAANASHAVDTSPLKIALYGRRSSKRGCLELPMAKEYQQTRAWWCRGSC